MIIGTSSGDQYSDDLTILRFWGTTADSKETELGRKVGVENPHLNIAVHFYVFSQNIKSKLAWIKYAMLHCCVKMQVHFPNKLISVSFPETLLIQ